MADADREEPLAALPAGDGAARGAAARKHAPYLSAYLIAHAWLYRDFWMLRRFFTGSDFFQQFVPLMNFQSDCLEAGSWPLWNPFMNFGYPWLDNYVSSIHFPTHLILSSLFRFNLGLAQLDILFWLAVGGIGVYLCCVELGSSPRAACLSALCFSFSGQMTALPSWNNNVYNACLFPFLLLAYHRSERKGTAFSLLACLTLGAGFLGGNISSCVLGGYFFSGYVLLRGFHKRRVRHALYFLGLSFVTALLLAAPKLVPLYRAMPHSPRFAFANTAATANPDEAVTWANFLSCLLPVKHYYSLFIGALPLLGLAHAAVRRTLRPDPVLALFLGSALLLMSHADGSPTFLRLAADALLPFVRPIRQEFTFWYYPTIFAVLYLSGPLDRFLEDASPGTAAAAAAVCALALTAAFLARYRVSLFLGAYAFHGALLLAWAGAVALVRQPRWRGIAAFLLVVGEFSVVQARTNVHDRPLRSGGTLTVNVTHQWHTPQSLYDSTLVKEKWPVTITLDTLRPTIDQSRAWPVLTPVTPGAPNPNWAEAMNAKKFLGWWYNTQERYEFVDLMRRGLLDALQGAPLYYWVDAEGLASVRNIRFETLTGRRFAFTVDSARPGALTLRQMFDDRWAATVDGKARPIESAEGYFMAVRVPPGLHRVEFRFSDGAYAASVGVSGLTLGAAAFCAVGRRRRPGRGPRAA